MEPRSARGIEAEPSADPEGIGRVEELLRALASAVRSYRLYSGDGPVLQRFVAALRERVIEVWSDLDHLRLDVAENGILWEGRRVFPTGDGAADLPFLFYKDGIRALVLRPGLEDELDALLRVIARAPQLSEEEDDLVTLLWEENLTGLAYETVDLPVDTAGIGHASGTAPAPVSAEAVRAEAGAEASASPSAADDFRDTLYFLDDDELRRLDAEVRGEMERDLWHDVLTGLLDRLEDGDETRQLRIAAILEEVLPSLLAASAYERAAWLLDELSRVAGAEPTLPSTVLARIRVIFGQLARRETLEQLVQVMEEPGRAERGGGLDRLLGYFPPQALAPLGRLLDSVARPDTRRTLAAAAMRLAAANRDQVVRLLRHEDPVVVRGALGWVAELEIGAAASEVIGLLSHGDAAVRAGAVEALVALRAAIAGSALMERLEDPQREVRIASARALATLEHAPARAVLGEVVTGKRIRSADRSEKIAFFESFGRLAGGDAVRTLDAMLNSRGWLSRGEPPEIRACAAIGLSAVRHPAARAALEKASGDADPVVRSAVSRALRGDGR